MSSPGIKFECLPTAIGSMPHADVDEACRLVRRYIPDIPSWPQLPQRSFKEGMCAQYSEGFPGMKVDSERAYVDQGEEFESSLEQLYTAYSENDFCKYAVSEEYAAGLHAFLSIDHGKVRCVKGQVTGPITWGMSAVNQEGLPIIYDETVADAVPMFLRLKAAWQESVLRQISDTTMIFVDEPSLSFLGTAGTALSDDQVVDLMDQVFGGIGGLKGTHCCGAADWSLLLRTSVDILNFDAYNYAESLALYRAEVKALLERGGSIAWGIVPSDEEILPKETAASLRDRLEEAMAPFTRSGVRFGELAEQSLITPSCGLASLSSEAGVRFSELAEQSLLTPSCGLASLQPEAAEHALELLADLSAEMRRKHLP